MERYVGRIILAFVGLIAVIVLLPMGLAGSLDPALNQVRAAGYTVLAPNDPALLREKRLTLFASTDAAVWANMPAAETEIFGSISSRLHTDLDGYSEFRLMSFVITRGATGSYVKLQFSPNNVTFTDAEATPNTGRLPLQVDSTLIVGSWAPLAAAATENGMYVRLAGVAGDGVADPALGNTVLEFRD